jgi:hypothetical protein
MAPGQVSASFERIQPTVLKLGVSPVLATQGATVTVNGQITPALPNKNVTLYVNGNGSSWKVLATTFTTANGAFSYIWQSDGIGVIGLRASWNGNNQYAGTSSETQSLLILPFYFILLATAAISAVGICMVLFASSKKSRNTKNNLEVVPAL